MVLARPPRVDLTLVGATALVAAGLLPVALAETVTTAVLGLALLVVTGRGGASAVTVAVLTLAVGGARAARVVAAGEDRAAIADQALPGPARCSMRASVASSPVRARGALRWDARVDRLLCDAQPVGWSGGLATLYGGPEWLARGDELEVTATLSPPERFWNDADGDPRPRLAHRGVVRTGGALDVRVVRRGSTPLSLIDRARARVRGRIDATFPSDLAPMARALVLGETDLGAEDDRAFRASGLSHLLAVSGMHLVLVLAAVTKTLEAILVRVAALAARTDVGRLAAALGLAVAWTYAEFAGGGGSTLRAAWMATCALGARAAGRRSDATRAFALSMAAMAAADPLVVLDVSFLLSAGATGGLLAFAEPLGDLLASRAPRLAAPGARAVATTIAASFPCAPILARFAPTQPLGGVLANGFAVPVGESAALPLCLAHAALAWWPAAERGCAAAASGALRIVRAIAQAASAPVLTAAVPRPTAWQVGVAALGLGALALRVLDARGRAALALTVGAALIVLELEARRAGAPRGLLRVTFLDVGQGDSALVDLPDGQAILVDGGGLVGSPIDVGERVISPELRARRRDHLALAVLTHPHPDHFGGLASGLAGSRVDALWDTGEGELEDVSGGYAALLAWARAAGTPVLRPSAFCGAHTIGGVTIEVLSPCPSLSPDADANDNSIVMRMTYGARSVLLVGDAQRAEEATLLAASRASLRADVLKVGHHGSRTSSTPEFLRAVAPEVAVISAGRRNRFGHPSPATLVALAAAGARVERTDRDGAVTVTTDGRSLEVRALARATESFPAAGARRE
jgi:competence protein ComEC